DFIAAARRWRQMVGGGMRQAGVFAAAGLYALDNMVARLADDHAAARRLHHRLAALGFGVEAEPPATNMVYCRLPQRVSDGTAFTVALAAAGVRVNPPGGGRLRFVTHAPLTPAHMDQAAEIIGRVLDETAKAA
ncbi:MAG: beta-eliminating lyase-related protein, partial [Alphaproteobacteria bacterium]